MQRAVERQVIERFIACGDPHEGFARIYCATCRHENVLAPVAHRQYVFTVPRLLRPIFSRPRAWLGELCRIAARLLSDAYAGPPPAPGPA